jgi:hypothetical protein
MGGKGSGSRRKPHSPDIGWRQLYHTNRWTRRRAHQLQRYPMCELCAARGLAVAAVIADHHPPHKGNERAFWYGPLRSLCKACHDGPARRGWSPEVDAVTGLPLDRNHPFYASDQHAAQVVPESSGK